MNWRRFPRVGTRVGRVLFLWDTFYLIGNLFHSTRDTFYFFNEICGNHSSNDDFQAKISEFLGDCV